MLFWLGRAKEGLAVQDEIREKGGEAIFIACDVSKSGEVDEAVEKVITEYGKIDILFNNAGGGDGDNFPNETDEGCERVLAVNLSGTFYMSRSVWPHMVKSGGGRIVNNSSLAAPDGETHSMKANFDMMQILDGPELAKGHAIETRFRA